MGLVVPDRVVHVRYRLGDFEVVGVFTVPGCVTLVVVMTFIGGIQLIVLGGMAEYIGRVYEEVKRRPLYVVRRLYSFDDES